MKQASYPHTRPYCICIILVLLSFNALYAQSICREPDSVKIVNHHIKSFTIYEYNYSDMRRDINHKYLYKHFDRDGRLTTKNEYSPGRSPYQTKFNYNEAGNLTAELTFDPYEQSYYQVKYKYDESGNPIEKIHYDVFGRLSQKSMVKYDDNGRPTEEGTYDLAVKLSSKEQYTYDENGRLAESKLFFTDGKMAYRVAYEYDEKNRCVKIIRHIAKDDKVSMQWRYQYDNDNNVIEETTIDPYGNALDRFTFKYDKKGNTKEQVYYYPADEARIKYVFNYKFYKPKK